MTIKNSHTKKAYAYTLSLLMLTVVITGLAAYCSQVQRQARSDYVTLEQAQMINYVSDDVEEDIASMLASGIYVWRNATNFTLAINDTGPLPQSPSYAINLSGYNSFLQSAYFAQTNANTSVSTSSFEQGGIVYNFTNPNGAYSHSNDVAGDPYHDSSTLYFPNGEGLLNLTQVKFSANCNSTNVGITYLTPDAGGNITASISYSDLTNIVPTTQSIAIKRGVLRVFSADFSTSNDSLQFHIDTTSGTGYTFKVLSPKDISCVWLVNTTYNYTVTSSTGGFVAQYPNLALTYSQNNNTFTKNTTSLIMGEY